MNIIQGSSNDLVGMNIRKLRNRRKMSQTALAKILGVSIFMISNMETGKTTIKPASLAKISEVFGVSLSQLLASNNSLNWFCFNKFHQADFV